MQLHSFCTPFALQNFSKFSKVAFNVPKLPQRCPRWCIFERPKLPPKGKNPNCNYLKFSTECKCNALAMQRNAKEKKINIYNILYMGNRAKNKFLPNDRHLKY